MEGNTTPNFLNNVIVLNQHWPRREVSDKEV